MKAEMKNLSGLMINCDKGWLVVDMSLWPVYIAHLDRDVREVSCKILIKYSGNSVSVGLSVHVSSFHA